LPAGMAAYNARSLSGMMIGAGLWSVLFSAGGLAAGWTLDAPVGAMTVVLAGAAFLAAAALRLWLRRPRRGAR